MLYVKITLLERLCRVERPPDMVHMDDTNILQPNACTFSTALRSLTPRCMSLPVTVREFVSDAN